MSELLFDPGSLPKKKGHMGQPGKGPDGETCGTCAAYTVNEYHNKTYRKCWFMRNLWTMGPGSDIRKRDPACEYWEKFK